MRATTLDETVHTLLVEKQIDIAAPLDIAWSALLEELGPGGEMPGGAAFPMVIETWPGGRWFRDLGEGAGHLWGHVQVIKPPKLLEICGPLFMSYPAVSHLQYRLTENDENTQLQLIHRAVGLITAEHREGVHDGWTHTLSRICQIADRLKVERASDA